MFKRNIADRAQVRALTDELRALHGRDDLLIMIDQEGGRVARMQAPVWPSFPAGAVFDRLYDIAPSSAIAAARGKAVLVDCLTLWASNLLLADRDGEAAADALCAAILAHDGAIILVANEVGLGIVPDNALARRFRDLAGTLNQRVAAVADQVVFVAAGLPPAPQGGRGGGPPPLFLPWPAARAQGVKGRRTAPSLD